MNTLSTSFSLFILIALFSYKSVNAQKKATKEWPVCEIETCIDTCADNLKSLYNSYGISDIVESRNRNQEFYDVMTSVSEPSTLSAYGTDYTHQINAREQKKMYVLNADVKVPISLGGSRWRMLNIQIIPRFRVRIFSDDDKEFSDISLPVRTPSYLPGALINFSTPYLWKKHGMHFSLYAYHHSNGQDGREFVNDSIPVPVNKNRWKLNEVNTYNGNFSELVVFEGSIGFYWKNDIAKADRYFKEINSMEYQPVRKSHNLKFYYEWHPKSLTNDVFRDYSLYGRKRFHTQYTRSRYIQRRDLAKSSTKECWVPVTDWRTFESHRWVVNASVICDATYNTGSSDNIKPACFDKRINIDLTFYKTFSRTPFASCFLQLGYYGSDTYNIYFQNSYWGLRGGLSFAFFRYDRDNRQK